MSLSQIEAELENLTPEELRHLAMKSRDAFVQKEGRDALNECNEDDPVLLRALDDALAKADAAPDGELTGNEVRARLAQMDEFKVIFRDSFVTDLEWIVKSIAAHRLAGAG